MKLTQKFSQYLLQILPIINLNYILFKLQINYIFLNKIFNKTILYYFIFIIIFRYIIFFFDIIYINEAYCMDENFDSNSSEINKFNLEEKEATVIINNFNQQNEIINNAMPNIKINFLDKVYNFKDKYPLDLFNFHVKFDSKNLFISNIEMKPQDFLSFEKKLKNDFLSEFFIQPKITSDSFFLKDLNIYLKALEHIIEKVDISIKNIKSFSTVTETLVSVLKDDSPFVFMSEDKSIRIDRITKPEAIEQLQNLNLCLNEEKEIVTNCFKHLKKK